MISFISVKRIRGAVFLGALALVPAIAVQGELITLASELGAVTLLDFNTFNTSGYGYTSGPVAVGAGCIMSSDTPLPGAVLGNGSYNLDANGTWDFGTVAGGAYTGCDSGVAGITFWLPTAVNGVGAFMNYFPWRPNYPVELLPPIITALGTGGVELESWDLSVAAPISTPAGYNAGEFRGIRRADADITGFRVSGSYILLDDLAFAGVAPVPEPSAYGIAATTLLAAGILVSRARLRSRRSHL